MTKNELSVFDGESLVGTIYDTFPLAFSYAGDWLESSTAYALPNLPLKAGRLHSPEVEAFFENLLPEGVLRELLSKQTQSSSTFALLLAVAGDTAGGLTILPSGNRPETPSYKSVEWSDIAKLLSGGLQGRSAAAPLGSRISLSGAQSKMLIGLDDDGHPQLPMGSTPSTWIIKPNIRGFEKVWNSAVNEAVIMRTAAHCGMEVAQVLYEPTTSACLVKRFDRTRHPNGNILRLRQYDFCQLSGALSGKKYESEGGPGLAACAEIIRAYSANAKTDLERLSEWTLFNLLTGNNDSHAKNLSLYELPGMGLRLTPFYDLMDTRLYPGLSKKFAFRVGDENEPGKITREHLVAMANAMQLEPALVLEQAKSLHSKLEPALDLSITELKPSLGHSGVALAEKLRRHVLGIANKLAARFGEDSHPAIEGTDADKNATLRERDA